MVSQKEARFQDDRRKGRLVSSEGTECWTSSRFSKIHRFRFLFCTFPLQVRQALDERQQGAKAASSIEKLDEVASGLKRLAAEIRGTLRNMVRHQEVYHLLGLFAQAEHHIARRAS